MTMYTYMEYLQKCFYKSTAWYEDNIYSNITGSSSAILDFGIPNGGKVDISSKTTDYSASSFTLSNYNVINGSLAYLYSSAPLSNTAGTKNVALQEAISGFKVIEPNQTSYFDNKPRSSPSKGTLLYGRMYFPGSALEAMVIKKFSPQTQLLIKSISNPKVARNGTMIVYLQNNTPKFSREFIYSTNEALLGFRCLYNFGNTSSTHRFNSNLPIMPKFDNSVVSIGTEIWYAAMTMSPGLSTAFRYSTRSTTTGKPLTMTMAINPILGQMSSTYTVKTSVASTFSSKYDFNFYSYESNLSLGFELYNYSNKQPAVEADGVVYATEYGKQEGSANGAGAESRPAISTSYEDTPIAFSPTGHNLELQRRHQGPHHKESVMAAFQNLVNESDFSSVVKFSTSLNDRMFKVLWEGRVKDFLVSTGAKITLNPQTSVPEFNKFGISFSYAN